MNKLLYDQISTLEAGVNSGYEDLLVPLNQTSWSVNATYRDGYISDRPPYLLRGFNFGGNSSVQTAVENGLWQGGCYYKPDTGTESLMAAIGGRLFQFTPDNNNIFQVVERTIPGDANPSAVTQAWLWQTENYVIWNDGQSFPVFFDGTSSRRSQSDQQVLGTTSLNFTIPPVGETVPVTLTAPFLGVLGESVLIEGITYQVVPPAGNSTANLTNLSDTPGNNYPIGTPIYKDPNTLGILAVPLIIGAFFVPSGTILFPKIPSTFPVIPNGTSITITDSLGVSFTFTVVNSAPVGPNQNYSVASTVNMVGPITFNAGAVVTKVGPPQPLVVVATLQLPFTAPAVNGTQSATINAAYTGLPNDVVVLGSAQYTIVAIPPSPPGTNLTLKNINGTPTTLVTAPQQLLSVPELPPGRMGAYGLGRNWESLTDGRRFIAGDIVGGSSGSLQFNFRDAVLKTTENLYLAGGGFFTVPSSGGTIQSMTFTSTLDSSLGQGALQIGTPNIIFSCNTPVDRTIWQSLTNPILTESLKGQGTQSQWGTINVNSDTFLRSTFGWASLILARREFATWGNVPISQEMKRLLDLDNKSLLNFESKIEFDNRVLGTATPVQGPQGVYWRSIAALNEDPLSSLRGKAASIWDGQWTGLNVLQLLTGTFNGVQRAFAFCWNAALVKIELYELLPTGNSHFDNDTVPIVWSFESAVFFNPEGKKERPFMALEDGEISVKNIVGRVDFKVQYRSDSDPCWHDWTEWSICGARNNPLSPNPPDSILREQYRPRIGFGRPDPEPCDLITNKPNRYGYWFQIRVVVQGHCRIINVKLGASVQPEPEFQPPICGDEQPATQGDCPPCVVLDCVLPNDTNEYTINDGTLYQNQATSVPINPPPGTFTVPAGAVKLFVAIEPQSPLRLLGCQCEIVRSIEGMTPDQIAATANAMVAEAVVQYAQCKTQQPVEPFFNASLCINLCPVGQLVNVNTPQNLPTGVFVEQGQLCVASGVFTSNVSFNDANQKATAFLTSLLNGLIASGGAFCGFWNAQQVVICPDGPPVTVAAFSFFSTISQADADNQAIAFGVTQCTGGSASCDGTDSNKYAISPYANGDVANPVGGAPSGQPIFNGTLPFKVTGNGCSWQAVGTGITDSLQMAGAILCNCIIQFVAGPNIWTLTFFANTQEVWAGSKSTGSTPAGVYTLTEGVDVAPLTLTVISLGPASSNAVLPLCAPD